MNLYGFVGASDFLILVELQKERCICAAAKAARVFPWKSLAVVLFRV
jgi:hypothetical protein